MLFRSTETPVRYPAAAVAASRNADAARQFVEHLLAAPSQAVLAGYGFGRP